MRLNAFNKNKCGLFYPNKTEKVRPNKTIKEDQLKSELE